MKKHFYIVIVLLFSILLIASCKKDSFISCTNAQLKLSADTLRYDTVFTSTGSITKSFKIINTNEQKLLLSKVKLMGGNASAYKMNVNGVSTAERNDIEIAANDSIYVFVTVTINPNATNLPFIVSDSIAIQYNTLTKFVQLQAYGQNAIFINNGLIVSNVNFTATLPYVILGSLQVASTGTLTLNAGTKIYCHADAPIIIDGTLIANGTKNQPVIFNGDRLDEPYNEFPASWPGIYCRAISKNNNLKFVKIKNAYQALVALQPSTNASPKIIISQSEIDNALDAGILATNSSVVVDNTLISNCGRAVYLNNGGTYSLTHCTLVSYSNNYFTHKNPTLFISDANELNQTNPLNTFIKNTIVYGDAGLVQNEIVTNKIGASYNVSFDNCLYRNITDPTNCTINQSIKNISPSFDSINITKRYFDFRITKNANAAGINKGIATSFLKDLDDKPRANGLPDIGAYEKQ